MRCVKYIYRDALSVANLYIFFTDENDKTFYRTWDSVNVYSNIHSLASYSRSRHKVLSIFTISGGKAEFTHRFNFIVFVILE